MLDYNQAMELATGAHGALIVCMLVMLGGYRLFITHVLPAHKEALKNIADQNKEALQLILKSHDEDRDMFRSSMTQVEARLTDVEKTLLKSKCCRE